MATWNLQDNHGNSHVVPDNRFFDVGFLYKYIVSEMVYFLQHQYIQVNTIMAQLLLVYIDIHICMLYSL